MTEKTATERRQDIRNTLASKKSRLERIANSSAPKDEKLLAAHLRRTQNAENFLSELDELEPYLLNDKLDFNIYLVTKSSMEKQSAKADFSKVDFDGEFCQLTLIQNCPYDDIWLLYTVPLTSL